MREQAGFIELERAVASIRVGRRHRTAMGDLDALVASIRRDGLLQPITITPDGMLVCGARRLAAIKELGWRTVNVWVRSGLSDRLGHLVAEQDDNALHKPLTKPEAAALYRELKQVMAEDAARRKAATQFSHEYQPGNDGPAKLAGPSPFALGTAREQAARMITGRASYTTLEKIGYLQQVADDPARPAELREQVAAGLDQIAEGAPVDPIYQMLRQAIETAQVDHEAAMDRLAREAVARATATKKTKKCTTRPKPAGFGAKAGADVGEPVRFPVRAFVLTWTELAGWWTHYDAEQLATELEEEQVSVFLATVEGTVAFADQLRAARNQHDSKQRPSVPVRLRAL